MSTILDSLKKSSDQRDDKSKASIDSFNFGSDKKSSKSGMLLVIVLIIITAAILYFGYDYLYADSDTLSPTLKTSETITNNPIKQGDLQNANLPVNKTTKSGNQKKQKPNSNIVKQKLKENQNKPKSNKDQNANKQPLIITKKELETKVDKTSSGVGTTSMPNEKPFKKLSMPNENKEKKKQKEMVVKQKYPYVYQLPFSIRKELPKLKLNIHVYDKDPLNRVAVINGVKFAIGDLIDEQVLLKDILQNGVLFDFNGHEFLVPNM